MVSNLVGVLVGGAVAGVGAVDEQRRLLARLVRVRVRVKGER